MLYRVHLPTNGAYSGCCLSILKEISTHILPFHSLLSTFILFYLLCLAPRSAIFSAISWRPVLVVEEAAVTDHGQATGKPYHLRCESSAPYW
jgi:hypothetical protein